MLLIKKFKSKFFGKKYYECKKACIKKKMFKKCFVSWRFFFKLD